MQKGLNQFVERSALSACRVIVLMALSTSMRAATTVLPSRIVDENAPASIGIEQKQPGSTIVRVRLLNASREPLRIYEDFLPWRKRYSIAVFAVPTQSGARFLQAVYPVDDFGSGKITLAPGREYTGEIDLAERFPDLKRVLSTDDVFAFWTYELKTVDRKSLGRQFGGLLLRRK